MEESANARAGGATSVLMFGVAFVVNLSISIVAPFLPRHLRHKNLLQPGSAGLVQGLLFSSSSVASLVMTPLAPGIMKRFGRIRTCAMGLVIFAVGIFIFGASAGIVSAMFGEARATHPQSVHPQMELAVLFLSRMIAACGGTLAGISSMSLAIEASPENRGMLLGASETAIGIGFSVGPSVGAVFFTVGGFAAPFAAMSFASLSLLPLLVVARKATACAPERETQQEAHGTTKPAMSPWRSPSTVMMALVAAGSMASVGFLDPTLAPFEADTLGASTAGAGVLFSAFAFPYALLGTVVGAVVDAQPSKGMPMMCGGVAALGVSFLALPPLVPFMATWVWQIFVLLFAGICCAAGMVPAVPVMTEILSDESRAAGCVAIDDDVVLSLVWTVFTAGEFVGPLIGSGLVESFGFSFAARAVGIALVFIAASAAAVTVARAPRFLVADGIDSIEAALISPASHRELLHCYAESRSVGLTKSLSDAGDLPHVRHRELLHCHAESRSVGLTKSLSDAGGPYVRKY